MDHEGETDSTLKKGLNFTLQGSPEKEIKVRDYECHMEGDKK